MHGCRTELDDDEYSVDRGGTGRDVVSRRFPRASCEFRPRGRAESRCKRTSAEFDTALRGERFRLSAGDGTRNRSSAMSEITQESIFSGRKKISQPLSDFGFSGGGGEEEIVFPGS